MQCLTSRWRPRHPHKIIPTLLLGNQVTLGMSLYSKVSAYSAEKGKMGGRAWSILLRQGGLLFNAVWYTRCQRNKEDTVAKGRKDGSQITLLCLVPPGTLGSLQDGDLSQKACIKWLHFHEASRTGKSLEKETRSVVARGSGRGEWGVITDGNRLSLEDEKLWRQDRGGGCQPRESTKWNCPVETKTWALRNG